MNKKKILIIGVILFSLIVIYFIFRNIYLGFTIEHNIYDITNGSQTIELGIPKL